MNKSESIKELATALAKAQADLQAAKFDAVNPFLKNSYASLGSIIETARPVLEAMVQQVTAVKVLSLHHDISTVTGEEVVLFTLAESPLFRETRKK